MPLCVPGPPSLRIADLAERDVHVVVDDHAAGLGSSRQPRRTSSLTAWPLSFMKVWGRASTHRSPSAPRSAVLAEIGGFLIRDLPGPGHPPDEQEARVVPRVGVFLAGIAQAHDGPHRLLLLCLFLFLPLLLDDLGLGRRGRRASATASSSPALTSSFSSCGIWTRTTRRRLGQQLDALGRDDVGDLERLVQVQAGDIDLDSAPGCRPGDTRSRPRGP